MTETTPQPEKLHFSTKLAYGAGDLGSAITANVLVFFLLYFFTNVAGLPAGLAGSILAIGKIGDAVNDPVTGILSDRTRTRWGRRLPWMIWGAIPFGLTFFVQWLVPTFSANKATNDWALFWYYTVVAILFNLAYTAVNLPYTALTPELTQDYNERTALNSFRMAFSIGGSILSLILAQVIFAFYPDDGRQQYLVLGSVCSILSVVAIFWCAFRIQERGKDPILGLRQRRIGGWVVGGLSAIAIGYGAIAIVLGTLTMTAIVSILVGILLLAFSYTLFFAVSEPHLDYRPPANPNPETTPDIPFFEQLRIAFTNKPFLFVIGLYLCSWLAVQLTASILIYFVVSCMGLPESAFPLVAIAVQGTALIMLFVWRKVSDRLGKKAVYFLGTCIWIIAQGGLFFLQSGQTGLLYLLAILAGCGVSVAYLIPWSMVPDVVELDELNTGQRREGIFYGFMVLLQKMGLALALWIVGISLELAGFVERPPGGEIPLQPETALFAIRVAIGPLPTIVLILGLILAYFYPITEAIHSEIRLKLQARRQAESIEE
ncbi:MAG: MFS transporter [Jaaginema sp. PMC 1079.18]|nr:MFS transporter [Jaaginema sp. PMC 1080.18]MEC4851516.1 MFS transporter [Jaaginema sp. PMC 1079.18]MEC4868004.1 MFS transporter [Jaaginema sp. PMC 1078.18]